MKEEIIRLGKNSKGEICVQIMLNIPLTDLIEQSMSRNHAPQY